MLLFYLYSVQPPEYPYTLLFYLYSRPTTPTRCCSICTAALLPLHAVVLSVQPPYYPTHCCSICTAALLPLHAGLQAGARLYDTTLPNQVSYFIIYIFFTFCT